jgi:hypothetical protein
MNRRHVLGLLGLPMILAACGGPGTRQDGLRARLYNYAGAIRWNDIDQAYGFVDPALREQFPYTAEEAARWQRVQVSRYFEGPRVTEPDGRVTQTVQIELIDRETQTLRTIIDRQRWRYDEATETWWLETGLPQLLKSRPN